MVSGRQCAESRPGAEIGVPTGRGTSRPPGPLFSIISRGRGCRATLPSSTKQRRLEDQILGYSLVEHSQPKRQSYEVREDRCMSNMAPQESSPAVPTALRWLSSAACLSRISFLSFPFNGSKMSPFQGLFNILTQVHLRSTQALAVSRDLQPGPAG